MFSDLWSKEETPTYSKKKRKPINTLVSSIKEIENNLFNIQKSYTTRCFNFKKYLTESLQQWAFCFSKNKK